MTRSVSLVLTLFVTLPFLATAQEEAKDPQTNVETAIKHAIKLLEAKDYKMLIDSFVIPEELKKMKEAGAYELVTQKFGEGDKPAKLKEALALALETKPEINEEKTVYRFNVKKEVDGKVETLRPVVFKKIEGRWYLSN